MRQWVSFVAVAAAVCLVCADSASARGRRGGCSSGGCSSGGCYSGGGYTGYHGGGGCHAGGCYSGGYAFSGCSTGHCGVAYGSSYHGGYLAAAPVATSHCVECAALGQREATLVVTLPESATLAIDDYQTKSTSAQRVFQTPPLESGKDFSYTLTAKVMRDGEAVTVSKKVTVRAGETTQITLEVPAKAVAAR